MQNNLKNLRSLLLALIISGCLNIVLAVSFGYWYIKETPPKPYFEGKPANHLNTISMDISNSEMVLELKKLSQDELFKVLTDKSLIENGFAKRDLALGCLVSFHHFDIQRALPNQWSSLERRSLTFGKKIDGKPAQIMVYSNLRDDQWQMILDFVKQEQWPLTARGLFFALKKPENSYNHSLIETFFLSQEFLMAEMLFSRAPVKVAKEDILEVLLQGTWQMLNQFSEEQKLMTDLSPLRRQKFLLDYIQSKSKAAALLILKTDGSFAVKKLDDPHILMILELLEDKNSFSERFALALLASPRGNAVWKTAANKLYDFAEEPRPAVFDYQAALAHFLPQHLAKPPLVDTENQKLEKKVEVAARVEEASPVKPMVVPQTSLVSKSSSLKPKEIAIVPNKAIPKKVYKDRLYIVQNGDNLWKLAKRFNVDVQLLRQHNRLETDSLKPGTPIRIPS